MKMTKILIYRIIMLQNRHRVTQDKIWRQFSKQKSHCFSATHIHWYCFRIQIRGRCEWQIGQRQDRMQGEDIK